MPSQQIDDPQLFLRTYGEGRAVVVHKRGDVIFEQGQPATLIYFLQRGLAKETVVSQSGKQVVVNMHEDGRFFGINGLFNYHLRNSTVTIIAPSTITAITQEAMHNALRQPDFASFFMTYLVEHQTQMEAQKADILLSSKPKRLAHTLVALAQTGIDNGRTRMIGPEITQDMLAAMTGTTRQYVNAILTRFRERGLIQVSDGIKVLPAMLEALKGSRDPV